MFAMYKTTQALDALAHCDWQGDKQDCKACTTSEQAA